MRPQIPVALEDRIQAVYEQAGYTSPSEFVREAARRRCEELESAQTLGEYAPALTDDDVEAMLLAIDAARRTDPGDGESA